MNDIALCYHNIIKFPLNYNKCKKKKNKIKMIDYFLFQTQ